MAAIQWRTGDGSRRSIGYEPGEDASVEVTTVPSSPPYCTAVDETSKNTSQLTKTSGPDGERVSPERSDDVVVGISDHHNSSSSTCPQKNNSATHCETSLTPGRAKVVERSSIRHSFRCSIKRRSMRLLKNLKTVKPTHLRMSSHTKRRNIANLAVYPSDCCVSTCLVDTGDIDKGEVVFFSYSDDGLSYTKDSVPICNAGCPKHRIRWNSGGVEECDDMKSHHGDDYDSGGEFGDCDDYQVEEVLADYSIKEAPDHVSTLGRLPSNHSFEAMSNEDFNSSFAYCETEHLNTIRRSTVVRKNDATSSATSLTSTASRKNKFVSNMNKKMSSKAGPLRSLWLFLTRQKDETHRKQTFDFAETMESATRYIHIASHYENAFIGVKLLLQRVQGASPHLRSVQRDLISTALKAFFTIEDDADVAWVDDVPREIQRQIAVCDARVHFPVPDIRQCVACLLLSPDATVLLRRRECILLKSIAEVIECREECLVVMQARPGTESMLRRSRTDSGASSSGNRYSTPPSPHSSAVSSLEWMTFIPSFSS